MISDRKEWIDSATYEDIFINTNIFNDIDINNDWYVYYTQKTIWTETTDSIEIKNDNWTYPLIARQVSYINGNWINIKFGSSIDQLNIFNQLTQGGSAQGFYYEDMGEAVDTNDVTNGHPKANIKYFQKIILNGSVNYEPVELNITWKFYEEKQKIVDPNDGKEVPDTEGIWYYYIKNINGEYSRVALEADFDPTVIYYKKIVKKY